MYGRRVRDAPARAKGTRVGPVGSASRHPAVYVRFGALTRHRGSMSAFQPISSALGWRTDLRAGVAVLLLLTQRRSLPYRRK